LQISSSEETSENSALQPTDASEPPVSKRALEEDAAVGNEYAAAVGNDYPATNDVDNEFAAAVVGNDYPATDAAGNEHAAATVVDNDYPATDAVDEFAAAVVGNDYANDDDVDDAAEEPATKKFKPDVEPESVAAAVV
jgi:hypothetical protein